MAPRSAPWARRAYLASTPRRVAGLGQLPARPGARSSSASSTSRSMVWSTHVDHDAVAVGDEGDRAAVDRLGRDVADAEPVGAAGEAAVGDERGVAAAAGALHGAGDGQHLAHARAALGALVADDDDVAGLDAARPGSASMAAVLAVEHPGRALEAWSKSMPATFTTEPLGASEPVRTAMPPTAWIGVGQRVDDLAVGRRRVDGGEVLGDGLAGDGEAVAVEQPGVEQLASSRPARRRSRSMSVMWYLPWGLVSAMWGTRGRDPVEVVEVEVDAGPRRRWPAGAARRWWSRRGP